MKRIKKFSPKRAKGKKFTPKNKEREFRQSLYQTTRWRVFRKRFLAANPKCYVCGLQSEIVDHIVAHKGNEEKFWDAQNMMPMCKSDHNYITRMFDMHEVQRIKEKGEYIKKQREKNSLDFKIMFVKMPNIPLK